MLGVSWDSPLTVKAEVAKQATVPGAFKHRNMVLGTACLYLKVCMLWGPWYVRKLNAHKSMTYCISKFCSDLQAKLCKFSAEIKLVELIKVQ